jgi:cytochrome c oxidase cbb3-type subunit III
MRFALVLTLFVGVVASALIDLHYEDARLLRADPDALQSGSRLRVMGQTRGAPLFAAHCATCHGIEGRGDTAKGIPNLTDDDWLYGTGRVSDVEQVIEFGVRSHNPKAWNLAIMPAYARARPSPADDKIVPLSPPEIEDLIEFLFQRQGRAADAGAAARGAALYYGKGGCYDCHASDVKGDSAIGAPNLSDRITLYGDGSKAGLFKTIAYGRQGVCPSWSARLRPIDIRDIALYVYSLSHTNE